MQRRFKCKISNFEAFFFFKGENLWVLGLSEGFLHIESKNIIHKREKTGFYENSMFSQKTLLRMRSSYLTKSLRVYTRLSELNKNRNNSIRKCGKDMKRHFTRRGHLFDK